MSSRSLHPGAFLILEGQNDGKFFKKFLSDSCKTYIAGNKQKVIDVINILDEFDFNGALAIVDADYDRILDLIHSSENIILTDTHDIETLILRSASFDYFLDEFASSNKMKELKSSVRDILLTSSKPLGCLRLISIRENLNLRFEGIKYKRFISSDNLICDIIALVRTIKNNSENSQINDKELISKINIELKNSLNIWDLCCGHDVVNILSIALQKFIATHPNQQVLPDFMNKSLRLCFTLECFKNTALFSSIIAWQETNANYKIISAA